MQFRCLVRVSTLSGARVVVELLQDMLSNELGENDADVLQILTPTLLDAYLALAANDDDLTCLDIVTNPVTLVLAPMGMSYDALAAAAAHRKHVVSPLITVAWVRTWIFSFARRLYKARTSKDFVAQAHNDVAWKLLLGSNAARNHAFAVYVQRFGVEAVAPLVTMGNSHIPWMNFAGAMAQVSASESHFDCFRVFNFENSDQDMLRLGAMVRQVAMSLTEPPVLQSILDTMHNSAVGFSGFDFFLFVWTSF
jgi:hypothetical protein